MKKRVIKVLIFIVVFISIYDICNKVFIGVGELKATNPFYNEKEDTLDIISIGSSHMFCTINPSILWNNYGITSYNFGGPGQAIWTSYHYMLEALKTQEPKLMIIDVFSIVVINSSDYVGHEGNVRSNIDNMKISINKFNAIENSVKKEDREAYYINFMKYHSGWKKIEKSDFNIDKDIDLYKGYNMIANRKKINKNDVSAIKELTELSNKNKEYLYKVINLAKEKNIELLFVSAPYQITENDQKIANSVYSILEEENISYIDYNLLYDEVELDFEKDFRDNGHLNAYGATKLTNHLGNYIETHYDIPDRRQDPEYAYWWDDTQYYYRWVDEQNLKTTTDIKKWIEQVQNSNNYIVLGSYRNTTNNKISAETIQTMKILGGEKLSFNFDLKDNYAFIIDNGQVIYEKKQKSKIAYKNEENWFKTRIDATTSSSSIKIEAEEYSKNKDGLNIVVYDKVLEKVVDSVNIGLTGKISR
ncbi:MAG: hypothetical protein LBL91_05705 [Lachnospiraceae bacterium]|jgi:hypothetical protein|nr:hypothetical protein [Lachnospiraceae bacterium]